MSNSDHNDLSHRLEEIERVRIDSIALGVHSEERRDELRSVIYGLEEDLEMVAGLVDAYAGSDDLDVVHLLSSRGQPTSRPRRSATPSLA